MSVLEIAKKCGEEANFGQAYFFTPEQLEAFATELQKDNLAKIARLHDALNSTLNQLSDACRRLGGSNLHAEFDMLNFDLSATKETRDAFIREIEANAFQESADNALDDASERYCRQ